MSIQSEHYEVLDKLGHGATSEVFLAKDRRCGRPVALKCLHPQLSNAKNLERLQEESSLISRLQHPGIVRVLEVNVEKNNPYLAMEFIDGGTLTEFLKREGLIYPEVAVILMLEIIEAVEHAHRQGVIHRDLKPDNVMLTKNGVIKIADFGLAKTIDRERLTQTGAIIGSPVYMSPEQALGNKLDGRSDLFSLGVILYELCTGKLPFEGENPHATLRKIIEDNPLRPDSVNSKVDRRLSQITLQAIAKNPDDRQSGVWELAYQLKDYLNQLGLLEGPFSFSRFINDKTKYLFDLTEALCNNLLTEAKDGLENEDKFQFLVSIDHLLAVAPEHQEGKALLQTFNQSQKRPVIKYMRSISAVGLLILIAIALIWQLNVYKNSFRPVSHSVPVNHSVPVSHPEPVISHPEPVISHPEPVISHPEPVISHPEPLNVIPAKAGIQGHPEPKAKDLPRDSSVAALPQNDGRANHLPKNDRKILPTKTVGFIKFNLDEDVDVEIDGKPFSWRNNPTAGLPPGSYKISLKKPGFSPINNVVFVKEGETSFINAKTP